MKNDFDERMNRRPVRCCGNCFFTMAPENVAPICKVNGEPINVHFTCDLHAYNEDEVTEQQWQTINEIAMEASEK